MQPRSETVLSPYKCRRFCSNTPRLEGIDLNKGGVLMSVDYQTYCQFTAACSSTCKLTCDNEIRSGVVGSPVVMAG